MSGIRPGSLILLAVLLALVASGVAWWVHAGREGSWPPWAAAGSRRATLLGERLFIDIEAADKAMQITVVVAQLHVDEAVEYARVHLTVV